MDLYLNLSKIKWLAKSKVSGINGKLYRGCPSKTKTLKTKNPNKARANR
jgi:hypothetical protein